MSLRRTAHGFTNPTNYAARGLLQHDPQLIQQPTFHVYAQGPKFNTTGAGVTIDEGGRVLFSTMYGKTRILRGPGPTA